MEDSYSNKLIEDSYSNKTDRVRGCYASSQKLINPTYRVTVVIANCQRAVGSDGDGTYGRRWWRWRGLRRRAVASDGGTAGMTGDVRWITCGRLSRIRVWVDRGQGRPRRPRLRGGGRRGGLDGERGRREEERRGWRGEELEAAGGE
jgi:hypothetical protein